MEQPLSPHDFARFEASVLAHVDAAYNLARHLLREVADAEDVVQEACLRAIRHFAGFRGVDGRAWLLRIVRNACFTELRRRRGGAAVEFDEEEHAVEDELAGPEADLERTLASEAVRAGLARLPVELREALVLRELEGLSYREIAEVAEVPIGTVMSRLSRARRRLLLTLGAPGAETTGGG